MLTESPIRPHLSKPDKAPVWLPRNSDYVVLTCTDCLRSFSLPIDEAKKSVAQEPCIHCGTLLRFVVERKSNSV